jgi:hypothetical protein
MFRQEKELEKALVQMLHSASSVDGAAALSLGESSGDAKSVGDLIGDRSFEIIEDDSSFNPVPKFMTEISGGMTPDIVLRSKNTRENRIYIEVKLNRPIGFGLADSQITRYLLHLLATTQSRRGDDIRRAVILAAPFDWFQKSQNNLKWRYFVDHYSGLATAFDVTLGAIYTDRLRFGELIAA